MIKKNIASLGLNICNTFSVDITHLNEISIGFFGEDFDGIFVFLVYITPLLQINLSQDNYKGLSLEQRFDTVEQSNLLIDGIATSLRDIKQKENTGIEMSKSGNSLHFNSVSLVQSVIEDTWGIEYLPSSILVVGVTHKEVLCCESVRLNINIGIGQIVNKTGLTNIREASNNQCSSTCINLWQSSKMLSDLFQITQTTL
mmetsp:Transcript_24732/g.17427  ORF Transcript_24732/g.17427 Transcript_24732/m.17427 type:complete len:200 (+) Transcript_24732:897-1496(+)